MNETDIRKYAELMKELGLTGLEITENDQVVRLERSAPGAPVPPMMADANGLAGTAPYGLPLGVPSSAAPYGTPSGSPTSAAPYGMPPRPEDNDCISIKSPIVGVFYAAPTENAAPFVSLGDRVEKGKTLCIIEAMKLMNEICSDEDGVISEICVTNGQVVEYGTELFKIRR